MIHFLFYKISCIKCINNLIFHNKEYYNINVNIWLKIFIFFNDNYIAL